MSDSPRWQRRKDARPAEIVAAALQVFAERGYAGARTEEIAVRAGISKGALYRYFDTKEAIFHAVVTQAVRPNIQLVLTAVEAWPGRFADLARMMLPRFAEIATALPLGPVVKMVIGESRNFPEIAKVWLDEVVEPAIGIVARRIAAAQAVGEVRPGDPRIHAFSLAGPMLLGVLWRETLTPAGAAEVDLAAIARQHVETVLTGMEMPK